MAKKADLLEKAKALKLEVSAKSTIAELEAAIAAAEPNNLGAPSAAEEAKVNEAAVDAADQEGAAAVEKRNGEKVAKAGKRSAKALSEAAEQRAKEERKATGGAEPAKPKAPVKPARSRLERRGKNFRAKAKLIDKSKTYSLEEAVELARQSSPVKFDATVELHVNLNVDPRQADQNVRANVGLPAGSGKTVRVAVFADEKVAGADLSGTEAISAALTKNEVSFDVLIAPPANMAALGKFARLLGPRGLMPNPKSGTVTTDLARAVAEAKAGRVEYRVDSTGIIHLGIGKASFTTTQLLENLSAVLASLRANKPASVKGVFIRSAHLSTTMGPSVRLDTSSL